jgi:hypothetical protein
MDILTHNEFENVHDDSLKNHYAFVGSPSVGYKLVGANV